MILSQAYKNKGFTLIEILMVVVILGISAMVAIPMLGSGASMQMRSAANKIAADIEYAKSMAISRQQNYTVNFDMSNNSYQIQDSSGTVISDPMKSSDDFDVDFDKVPSLSAVSISAIDFDGESSITFDYLGSPYAGSTSSTPLIDGSDGITISAGDMDFEIIVEPVTGYISIQ